MAIIKRPQPLDPTIPLHAQLQIINLPGTVALNGGAQGSVSPFEILHALVHSALAPYFDAYTKGQETQVAGRLNRFADTEAKTGMLVGSNDRAHYLRFLRYSCDEEKAGRARAFLATPSAEH